MLTINERLIHFVGSELGIGAETVNRIEPSKYKVYTNVGTIDCLKYGYVDQINQFIGEARFLSNFYVFEVFHQGISYKTVEHAYQAAKTNNSLEKKQIAQASTPGVAKRLGSKCELREDWDEVKLKVMKSCIKNKFSSGGLMKLLLKTEDLPLIEGNNWGDTFWGVNLKTGKGKNNLGKILMAQRESLRSL